VLDSSAPLFHTARYTEPQQVLEAIFGYREFRPGQRRIIDAVLAGRDCIGVMPTGAGKSLTFQVPAKILPGAVLVISPLISLMKDQVDALTRFGFRAVVLNSTLEFEERRARLQQLRRGELELVHADGHLPAFIGQQELLITRIPEVRELALQHDRGNDGHAESALRFLAQLRAAAVLLDAHHTP
jgi:superfamily II DNA helicase RecQ